MAKNKDNAPYYLNMVIPKENMKRVPPDMEPATVFMNTILSAIVNVSKKRNGLAMSEHRKFKEVRIVMERAIDEKKPESVELSFEHFKFIKRYWEEQTPDASLNELLMCVDESLQNAEKAHNDERSKELSN